MKFTKEQAVQDLNAKFTAKAKDIDLGRTISEAVDNGMAMIGENSEMELDAFVGFIEKNVSSALGLARHENSNVATKMQEKIAELEAKIGKAAPKTETEPSQDGAIQEILSKVEKLEQEQAKREHELAVSAKRSELVAEIAKTVKDKSWIETMLTKATITPEMDVVAEAKDYVEIYNKTSAGEGRSFTPKTAGGGGTDNYVKQSIEAAKNLMQQKNAMMGGSPVTTKTV